MDVTRVQAFLLNVFNVPSKTNQHYLDVCSRELAKFSPQDSRGVAWQSCRDDIENEVLGRENMTSATRLVGSVRRGLTLTVARPLLRILHCRKSMLKKSG